MATSTLLENKKVHLRYSVLETFQAGMELFGGEVKSVRAKLGKLDGARVIIRSVLSWREHPSLPGREYVSGIRS
jgi:tmRNA-binding protein